MYALKSIPLDELVALRRNPQYLTDKQQKALEQSIQTDGFLCPIVVRKRKGKYEILSGNHRVLASRSVGLKEIPCVVVHPCSDAMAARIAVNMNSVHGDPNVELLAPFLAEMSDDVLSSVYLEDSMLSALRDFDETLKARLDALEIPDELNEDSRRGATPNCKCKKCGHMHVAAPADSKSSTRPTTGASKAS